MSIDDDLFGEGDRYDERLDARLRQLGTREPRCSRAGCDEVDPFALTGVAPYVVCYECRAEARGREFTEAHHAAGQANDPATVRVPGNDHRVLSSYQQLWPERTLRNPDGSPLLRAAAALRGWLDVLRLVLDRALARIPGFLERLDAWLLVRVGPRWWVEFEQWS